LFSGLRRLPHGLQPFNTVAEFLRQDSVVYKAGGICKEAEEQKMIIGSDIRVIGFDDLPMARCMTAQLTMFRIRGSADIR